MNAITGGEVGVSVSFGVGKELGFDPIGHSQFGFDNNVLIDWGPAPEGESGGFFNAPKATNHYKRGDFTTPKLKRNFWENQKVSGVNRGTVEWYSGVLNKGGKYQLFLNSCVSQTSRTLNMSGVFNIGIHPYLLHSQMYLRNIGVRLLLFLHYTHNNKIKRH